MEFILLVLDAGATRDWSDQRKRDAYDRMMAFVERLRARGLQRYSEALHPDAEGARVRVRDGRRTVTPGPFTDTPEPVGGYFVIDCASPDEALALAAECPAAEWGTIEVRQIRAAAPGEG